MQETMDYILNKIRKRAEEFSPRKEKDYIKDGLLYCGNCNTPKQCRIDIGNGKFFEPYCICECKKAELEVEKKEIEKRERQKKIESLRQMGFPESEMHKWTFSADDGANAKISKVAMNYVENFSKMQEKGKGLLFYGTVGTGKTFYSACIANALIDRGIPCLITNFARLVNTISGMYDGKQAYIDGLNRFDLLVIDDLASERDTEYMNEIVQMIIDSRYRAGLPTIITTNLTAEEIKNPVDVRKQRTYSRLLEMTIPVEVVGSDRRREKLKHDYAEFNELLGL